jgi:hypothetical protein
MRYIRLNKANRWSKLGWGALPLLIITAGLFFLPYNACIADAQKQESEIKRMPPELFFSEIRDIERILYDDGPTRLEHLEELWWDVYGLMNYVNWIHGLEKVSKKKNLKRQFDMPIEPFMRSCKKLMNDITGALVNWSDRSILPIFRAQWEKIRSRFFINNPIFKTSSPQLDKLQSKREPANDSDLIKLLDRLESFIKTSQKEARDLITRHDELGNDSAYIDMKSELRDQLDRWCFRWIDKLSRFEKCERQRPKWKKTYSGKLVLDKKKYNKYHIPPKNQGPIQLKKVFSLLDRSINDLRVIRYNFGAWRLQALKNGMKNFKWSLEHIEKARQYLKELGFE